MKDRAGRIPEGSPESDYAVAVYTTQLWWARTFRSHLANSLIGSHLESWAIELVEESQESQVLA